MKNNEISEIVEKVLHNKEKYYSKLYKICYPIVYNLIYNMTSSHDDTSDLTQEVMLKVYNKIDTLESNYAFNSWLKRVSVNHTLDFLKKQTKNLCFDDSYISTNYDLVIEPKSIRPDQIYKNKEMQKVIRSFIEKLPPASRVVIVLFYFEEYKISEIATFLNVSEQVVKNRLFSGRNLIKKDSIEYEVKHGVKIYSSSLFASLYMCKNLINKPKKLFNSNSVTTSIVVLSSAITLIVSTQIYEANKRHNDSKTTTITNQLVTEQEKIFKATQYKPDLELLEELVSIEGSSYLLNNSLYDEDEFNNFLQLVSFEKTNIPEFNNILYHRTKGLYTIYLCINNNNNKIYYKILKTNSQLTPTNIYLTLLN